MKNNQKTSKLMYIAAMLMFVLAVFNIADWKTLLGVIWFAGAACFTSSAAIYSKKAAGESKNDNAAQQE